jgi:hypothetical protein
MDERTNDIKGKRLRIFINDPAGVVARTGEGLRIERDFIYFLNERHEEEALALSHVLRFVVLEVMR